MVVTHITVLFNELSDNSILHKKLTKQPYQQRPLRYEYHLTDKGLGLLPVIQQLALWSQQHHPECYHIPAEFFALSTDQATGKIR
ncbi:winged helix-turn-helix transcriptional regulator [Bacterioplanoides pacificum]|uniref:Winged helix-turn-helix transcriptional regulator n=1 Tax=Bacterioplanoides pacificum TaxID=1171596 RepID=A0ABV7VTW8_9GAMM